LQSGEEQIDAGLPRCRSSSYVALHYREEHIEAALPRRRTEKIDVMAHCRGEQIYIALPRCRSSLESSPI
jgi:hypothetical protein